MDSYDEVHDVKNGQNIATPPESLENIEKGAVSGVNAIKFTPSEEEEEVKKEKVVPTYDVSKS